MSLTKLPRLVFEHSDPPFPHTIFAFPPNRDTLGGTAYFIVENLGNILIDCPAWDDRQRDFLLAHGGVRWLLITHRGGIGKARQIQAELGCELVMQEQEAYLIPGATITQFAQDLILSQSSRAIWTAGHSPGSACLYHQPSGTLFSGRHLLPDRDGHPTPLRTAKTFHWPRQIRNTQKLIDQFSADTLRFICPGASLGLLRGQLAIAHAYEKLTHLDLTSCLQAEAIL